MNASNESQYSVNRTPSLSTFQAAVDIETLIRRNKEFLEVKVQAVGRMTKPTMKAKVMPKIVSSANRNSGIESARVWFRHFWESESSSWRKKRWRLWTTPKLTLNNCRSKEFSRAPSLLWFFRSKTGCVSWKCSTHWLPMRQVCQGLYGFFY